MSHGEELVQIEKRPKLLVLEGGASNDTVEDDTPFNSELYFSNQIFRALLDELKEVSDQAKANPQIESQNLFRRAMRLLGMGLQLAKTNLFVKSNELSRAPTTAVYRYIEELLPFFVDAQQDETADFLSYLLTNEVVSEIVTTLMVRPGREKSAACLAVHFGLVEADEAQELLESYEITQEGLPKAIKSAHHDIDEIAPELQYQGNIKILLAPELAE